jgi:integrase
MSPNIRACIRFGIFSRLGALIERKDGGLELPIKIVQQRLGHSSIVMTSDVYGHLFPRSDDTRELAKAERLLLA